MSTLADNLVDAIRRGRLLVVEHRAGCATRLARHLCRPTRRLDPSGGFVKLQIILDALSLWRRRALHGVRTRFAAAASRR